MVSKILKEEVMLGEIYEIIKFLIGIINGEYSKTFFFILLTLVIIVTITEIIIEQKKRKIESYPLLVLEKIFWNILGVIFYISIYVFIMKLFSNIPFFDFYIDTRRILGEMGILSYITTIIIIPVSYLMFRFERIVHKTILIILQFLLVTLFTKILIVIIISENTFSYPLLGVHILLSIIVSNILVYYSQHKA